ncbi:MAG: serine/threonine protein kinase [Myxococcales bacterium]|nr:serine/threonine protein kinase [Myxococcales bacterium]
MEPELETKVQAVDPKGWIDAGRLRQVGRYELVQRLGYGGMATVFLARARGIAGFQKLVAVKVIHPHLAAEPEFVEMFLNEARVAAMLSNPHVGEVLDVGEDEGLYYMVMEYIEGETLSSLLRSLRERGETLPYPVILQIVADACAGLSAVHELSSADGTPLELVHRDVSPQNLLLTVDGWVKLVDFGIVKATGAGRSTLTGHLRGKLPYMSPEQARGRSLSRATDVFALGAILWELCAGRRLFASETDAEILAEVMRCGVPPLSSIREDLPDEVATRLQPILDRALAREPGDRYPTATAMGRELQALLGEALREHGDPRASLAAILERCFGDQLAYRRANVRRTGRLTALPSPAANIDPMMLTEPARDTPSLALVVGDGREASSSGQGRIESLSHARISAPVLEEPQTLTTASSPSNVASRRGWAPWLALPLVGAGIALAAIRLSDARSATPPEPTRAPASIADDELEAPHDHAPEEAVEPVTWYLTTDPPGAALAVTGPVSRDIEEQLAGKLTPVRLELAYSDEPLEITVRKDGFEPRTFQRMPVRHDNIIITLEPAEHASAALASRRGKRPTKLRLRAPPRDKHEGSDTTSEPIESTEPEPLPEPSFKPLKPRSTDGG